MANGVADVSAKHDDATEQDSQDESLAYETKRQFLILDDESQEVQGRVKEMAKKLRRSGSEPATQADLASIYDTLSGDVLSLVQDLIRLSGAATTDIFSFFDNSDDDTEESDDDDDALDQDAIRIYSTLRYNKDFFAAMLESPQLDDQMRSALQSQVQMNEQTIQLFVEQYGDEVEKSYQEMLQRASTMVNNGSTPPKSDSPT